LTEAAVVGTTPSCQSPASRSCPEPAASPACTTAMESQESASVELWCVAPCFTCKTFEQEYLASAWRTSLHTFIVYYIALCAWHIYVNFYLGSSPLHCVGGLGHVWWYLIYTLRIVMRVAAHELHDQMRARRLCGRGVVITSFMGAIGAGWSRASDGCVDKTTEVLSLSLTLMVRHIFLRCTAVPTESRLGLIIMSLLNIAVSLAWQELLVPALAMIVGEAVGHSVELLFRVSYLREKQNASRLLRRLEQLECEKERMDYECDLSLRALERTGCYLAGAEGPAPHFASPHDTNATHCRRRHGAAPPEASNLAQGRSVSIGAAERPLFSTLSLLLARSPLLARMRFGGCGP